MTLGPIFTSAVAIDHLCTAMFIKRGRHGKQDPGTWKRARDSIIAIIVAGGAEPLVRLTAIPGPSTLLRNNSQRPRRKILNHNFEYNSPKFGTSPRSSCTMVDAVMHLLVGACSSKWKMVGALVSMLKAPNDPHTSSKTCLVKDIRRQTTSYRLGTRSLVLHAAPRAWLPMGHQYSECLTQCS